LVGEIVATVAPAQPVAVLSGPTFAHEVARGLPTAITLACADEVLGRQLVATLGRPTFRPYWSPDVVGAEIGGAVKNVLAIACGIAAGRGLGENAKASIITRGFAELLRFGAAKGAKPETLMGLCGLGDLILTCGSAQSRNMSLGLALGQGQSAAEALSGKTTVAEGAATAPVLARLATDMTVDMPICQAVAAILAGADVTETITALLTRPFRDEAR
jgi:glycerol-3-phosphate dehydrogenase (NAD(P)+)